jgi:methylenetetrahydrofolate dehydrogenase (NADP+) / methenyltetrahydrofolate cyclohydrolase
LAATVIDGRAIAAEITTALAETVGEMRERHGITPCLGLVLVGEDPASQTYVRSKGRMAARLGLTSRDHLLPESTSEDELLAIVAALNGDPLVHGILVQLPLPAHIDQHRVLMAVDPAKDVDGFHPVNLGQLLADDVLLRPCTPAGCLELIRRSGTALKGKEAVVVGRSIIVGKPVALLMLREHATVTIAHSRTADLGAVCRRADILVVAAGRAGLVDGSMVKSGATVIDVGTNRTAEGTLVGDVEFGSAVEVAGAITPVPKGVGPMTIAMLMRNTVQAARVQNGLPPLNPLA